MPVADHVQLGAAVRAAREARGWSQEELGRRGDLDRATVNRLEGGTPAAMNTVFKVLTALDMRIVLTTGPRG